MIELIDVSKTFYAKSGNVEALKNVSLEINDGEIFGVIGYSGAGKSTLVRCINLLERPTQGQVIIDNIELNSLSEKELRKHRRNIGMIFQQFNLLGSRTVYENIAFPLRYQKKSKKEIDERVKELLKLVGIEDKINAYPSQLSGGQKQRVAIARALANDPKILLCDEATSALDPQTKQSILTLLKSLNKQLGITIVVITHEMAIIKEICDRVAVMEEGHVVEIGDVVNVFAKPQAQITKHFINTTNNLSKIDELQEDNSSVLNLQPHQTLLKLKFFGEHTRQAVITEAARKFNVNISIILANVEAIKGVSIGELIVILDDNANIKQSVIDYLLSENVEVEALNHG